MARASNSSATRTYELYGGNTVNLSPPEGLVAWKYVDFRDNDEFPEMGMVGPYETAKSTSLIDFLFRRAIEYPGSNTLFARGTLSSLKNSSLLKLVRRVGAVFESGNENEAVYRLPPALDPWTGQETQSIIKGIGLDRVDLEQVFRSTEYFTGAIEEGDEVDSDAHDILQARLRQVCYHKDRKVYHLAMLMGERWGVSPEEAYEIMLGDSRHPVGQNSLKWDDPMPGSTVLKTVWNPKGDQDIWSRYVGVPYPQPKPTPQWVEQNVGVREVHVDPKTLRGDDFHFPAGAIIKHSGGARKFAARHDEKAGKVYAIDGSEYDEADCGLIVQRACIYVFREENESRNYTSDVNSYLMVNRGLHQQAFHGAVNSRMGRVFPNFVDDYVENGGNKLRYPGKDRLAAAKYRGFGGIDQGGGHATGIVAGIITPETGIAIFYDEYIRSGVAAKDSAYDAQAMVLPGTPEFWWSYDPAMEAKEYGRDVEYAVIDEYQILGTLMPGDRGREPFDYVNGLLVPREYFIGDNKVPKLLVFDNCHYIIETLTKLTWKMVSSQRDNWMVDAGDAIKIALSGYRKMSTTSGRGMSETAIINAPATYSDRFA